MLKRFELPDGQWADMLVEPKHADYVAVMQAQEEAATGNGSIIDWKITVGQRFVKAWNVRGEDGEPLKIDDWSQADPRVTMALCDEALVRWREWEARRPPFVTRKPDLPKTPEKPSDDTSEDDPSS